MTKSTIVGQARGISVDSSDLTIVKGINVQEALDELDAYIAVLQLSSGDGSGANGLSAYQIWLAEGNTGTEAEFLASLVGPPGADSTVPGPPGADSTVPGPPGPPGADSTVPGPPGSDATVTVASISAVRPDLDVANLYETYESYIKGLSPQAWNAVPVDNSAIVNAAIMEAFDRISAGGDKSGPMEIVIPWAGVIYGSFEMAPGVNLRLGPKTMLAAMPGQASPVVDYASNDAFQTTFRGGRVMGNRRNGATCRGIDMSSSNNDAYAQPFPQIAVQPDFPEIVDTSLAPAKWFNTINRIENVFVYDVGGDRGVFIGRNQRGCVTDKLRVNECANVGVELVGTDTQHYGMNVGVCSDNILVRGVASKIIGFKSWYAGRNTGYKSGHGDGIRVDTGTGAVGIVDAGDTILIGETQDNARYGWCFLSGHGHQARGVSAGDVGVVFLGADGGAAAPTNCDIELVHSVADLAGPTSGVTIDTAGSSYNKVRLGVDPTHVDAAWVPVKLTNAGNLATNDVTVVYGAEKNYVNAGTPGSPYIPDTARNGVVSISGVTTALTIGPCPVSGGSAGYRREISFDITTGVGGSIVWDASYVGAPVIGASARVFVTFYNTNRTSVASITWIKK